MTRVNEKLGSGFKGLTVSLALAAAIALPGMPAAAQQPVPEGGSGAMDAGGTATFADLATLADRSDMVIRAQIRDSVAVEPERAPGLAPGHVRLYIEARTQALLSGEAALGESLAYLVDLPLNARGKAPKLKNREVLLFADRVPGRPGFVQLTGKGAQLDYSPALEARVTPLLQALAARDAPPAVTGVGDALAVRGTLAGESETQVFLTTADRSPVSITVLRRPGQEPVWGVSWGEIIDSAARPPRPESLRWYRLACALPPSLPSNTNLARDAEARRLAEVDYEFVVTALGPCTRAITEAPS
ncbi:hypothetical protein [Erythrobacter sp.]|jgi:hypothetical protein|uniref:hypothetical protein n=1 Tax=Erythrobacter sp. TaxID=1042 RepID=UPI002EBF41C6|nr:hypothetical protein [Erythrobacter sp.]